MPIFRFDDFELDTDAFELRSAGDVIALEPQVFALLQFLIEQRDRVVSKDEIINEVWEGRIISDTALNTRIGSVRKALGDDGKTQAFIRTFPRRGFRFVAEVGDAAAPKPKPASNNTPTDRPSIAVLPFDNLSNDPDQEYFSDGITEDIITALSRLRWLSVIARSTTYTFKGQEMDVPSVAQELGVRYVLEGSVRKSGNRLRISARLLDGSTGNHIWADQYDRDLEDVFALQDEITATVAGSVQSELGVTEQRRVKSNPPESLDAWDAYQRGMALLNVRSLESVAAAREQFERAMELDDEFVLPYAGYVETVLYRFGPQDRTHWDKTRRIARRAVELDPTESRAHTALGRWHMFNDDRSSAVAEFATAIELNPSDAQARIMMGAQLILTGRAEQGIPHLLLGVRQSPRDAEIGRFYVRLSYAHVCIGDYETAIEWGRKGTSYPNAPWSHMFLTVALALTGNVPEAQRVLDEGLDRRPELTIAFIRDSGIVPHPEYQEIIFKGLRQAGLPEK